MLVATCKKKGALTGSIYGNFNYISQTEFQLEGKGKKKKERKDVQHALRRMVMNLWLRIMVNKVAVHQGIICTLTCSFQLPFCLHHKQNAHKGVKQRLLLLIFQDGRQRSFAIAVVQGYYFFFFFFFWPNH